MLYDTFPDTVRLRNVLYERFGRSNCSEGEGGGWGVGLCWSMCTSFFVSVVCMRPVRVLIRVG